MRYRLRTLLIVLAWIGAACLALRTPTAMWSFAAFISLVLALLTSALVIIYRRGPVRAFTIGFLMFGCSLLILLFLPSVGRLSAAGGIDVIADLMYKHIHGQVTAIHHLMAFEAIIHSLFVILFGLMGGVIAQLVHATARENA
jgi:hypothetical protein